MTALYNEIDGYAVDWLRNLERAAHIAPGSVDARSICDLVADDVRGATQFHAFAGIGVWSAALRAAGWPDDCPVWSGSCPCSPFSDAGAKRGFDDERHLWPEWFRLIRECLPSVIVGEQVASQHVVGAAKKAPGRERVPTQIPQTPSSEGPHQTREGEINEEITGVRSGRSHRRHSGQDFGRPLRTDRPPLPPGRRPNMGQSVARPNQSDVGVRAFEHSGDLSRCQQCARRLGRAGDVEGCEGNTEEAACCLDCALARARREDDNEASRTWVDLVRSDLESVDYTVGFSVLPAASVGAPHRRQRLYFVAIRRGPGLDAIRSQLASGMAHHHHQGREVIGPARVHDHGQPGDNVIRCGADGESGSECEPRAMGDSGRDRDREYVGELPRDETQHDQRSPYRRHASELAGAADAVAGFWGDAEWVWCSDGTWRPVKPGDEPLAHGVAGRMVVRRTVQQGDAAVQEEHWYNRIGALKALGNAIVRPQAAAFLEVVRDLILESDEFAPPDSG